MTAINTKEPEELVPVATPPHPTETHQEPRVAMIAIHGVGRHQPGASAEAVATLLMSIGRNGRAENKAKSEAEPTDHAKKPSAADGGSGMDDQYSGANSGSTQPTPRPYSGFLTTAIDVPIRPVQSSPDDAEEANERYQSDWLSQLWGIFDERRGFLSETRKRKGERPHGYDTSELRPDEPDRGEYGYRFMVTQLAGYKGQVDRDFQTVRLEGKRKAGSRETTVHIYDAHYSDLSKPQSSIVAFFFSFYQLLFHLASLSLLAVFWTEAENVTTDKQRRWRWRMTASLHATSVRLLTMFIPILNVVLLEIAVSAFIDKTNGQKWLTWVAFTVAASLGLGAGFAVLRKQNSPTRPFVWASIPALCAAAGIASLSGLACLYKCSYRLNTNFSEILLLLSWLVIAGALLAWIAAKFNGLRPGAFWVSIVLFVGNCLWFLLRLFPDVSLGQLTASNHFATASLWAVQWIFAELLVSWVACLSCELVSWPLSAFCKFTMKAENGETTSRADERKARAIAAFRTGRFAFAIPTILFVAVTCMLWSGVVAYGSKQFKAYDRVTLAVVERGLSSRSPSSYIIPSPCAVSGWMNKINPIYAVPECQASLKNTGNGGPTNGEQATSDWTRVWTNYLRGLLLVSVTPSLALTMMLFTMCLLLLTWAALPSVLMEIYPHWTRNTATERIRFMGEWLSRGLDNTAILTRLLWFAIVPMPLFLFAFDWRVLHIGHALFTSEVKLNGYVNRASQVTLPLVETTGLALAVAGAAIFGFILKYLTAILDAVLDVDNYLRTSPIDETPRAKIAERITSLLRYIALERDDQDRPYYSKLIIVAHSLGSMVTTDLLRYLERSGKGAQDAELDRYAFRRLLPVTQRDLPIYVFTMGSPLRQLLNRFFPHLYWWVSDVPDNSLTDVGSALEASPVIASSLPRTDEMNVAHWSNAYRSGDYIGRSLWVGQWLKRNNSGDPAQAPTSASAVEQDRDEICIGMGAHTHYWDRSAADVAARLDALV